LLTLLDSSNPETTDLWGERGGEPPPLLSSEEDEEYELDVSSLVCYLATVSSYFMLLVSPSSLRDSIWVVELASPSLAPMTFLSSLSLKAFPDLLVGAIF
jgi:hypothetical protein